MLKYLNTAVTFQEVPDEISLVISITNCNLGCKGCNSPWLSEDIGEPLTDDELQYLISGNKGITCVCFLGGDSDVEKIRTLSYYVHLLSENKIKTAWYSGKDEFPEVEVLNELDYIKIGHYDKDKGGLNKKTTNQKMYKISHSKDNSGCLLEDITYKFQ